MKVSASQASVLDVADSGLTPPDLSNYELVPGGHWMHKSCVHHVPNGSIYDARARTIERNGVVFDQIPDCAYPSISARTSPTNTNGDTLPLPGDALYWERSGTTASSSVIYDEHFVGTGIGRHLVIDYCAPWFNYLGEDYTVPSQPSRTGDGQILYFWQGLQGDQVHGNAEVVVIQPVLQWGITGENWSVASYYVNVTTSVTIVSDATNVSPGDTISTSTYSSGGVDCSLSTGLDCNWFIEYSAPLGANGIGIRDEPNEFAVGEPAVMEVYDPSFFGSPNTPGVELCSDYPSNNEFVTTGIQIYQPSSSATTYYNVFPTFGDFVNSSAVPSYCDYSIDDNFATTSSISLTFDSSL